MQLLVFFIFYFCCVLLQMTAGDLKDNLKKLNNSMAFLIKHSQKLFRVIIDHTHNRTIKLLNVLCLVRQYADDLWKHSENQAAKLGSRNIIRDWFHG